MSKEQLYKVEFGPGDKLWSISPSYSTCEVKGPYIVEVVRISKNLIYYECAHPKYEVNSTITSDNAFESAEKAQLESSKKILEYHEGRLQEVENAIAAARAAVEAAQKAYTALPHRRQAVEATLNHEHN